VAVTARSPFGVSRVKLEVEVKALGEPYNGQPEAQTGLWEDIGLAGVELREHIVGLSADTAYHWRARVLYDPSQGWPQNHSPWMWGGVSGDPNGVHIRASCPVLEWYPDCDGDGYFAGASAVQSCVEPTYDCTATGLAPAGWSNFNPAELKDCNDEDGSVYPIPWYYDCDDDGAFFATPFYTCSLRNTDCDWTETNPGLLADCNDANSNHHPGQTWYADCDGDTYFQDSPVIHCDEPEEADSNCVDGNPPVGGWTYVAPVTPEVDCDDDDAAEYPGQDWYPDCDGDDAFSSTLYESCNKPDANLGICNDAEVPDGGFAHQAPSTAADCDDEDAAEYPGQTWYADCDDDQSFQGTPVIQCDIPDTKCVDGYSPDGGWINGEPAEADCDDENAALYPGLTWYPDCDGDDAFSLMSQVSCLQPDDFQFCEEAQPEGGYSHANPDDAADCDDEDAAEYPGQTWYPDCDDDGAINQMQGEDCAPSGNSAVCVDNLEPDGGWSTDTTKKDCDDEDPDEFPGQLWYPDCDNDGYFWPTPTTSCSEPNVCSNLPSETWR
ncbi:MAG: hypothetical protein HN348_31135, partial [Proteobacteria bacterium]|nr:hypothetical protein [Pseudomonadota bacterium]